MKSFLFSLLFLIAVPTFAEDLPNLHNITPVIFRGGRPTIKGVQILKSNGIKSIINLENVVGPVSAERENAKKLGMGFMSSPVSWIRMPTDEQMDKILKVMSNPNNQPIYVHCLQGRDRTGLVAGLYRVLIEKVSPRDAFREMKELGFRSLFVTLDLYFRQRTNFWTWDYMNRAPMKIEKSEDLEGELHDDADVFIDDPYDLKS